MINSDLNPVHRIYGWLATACRFAAVSCILLALTLSLHAQAQDPGQRGQAAAHAAVNFTDLARQEAEHPPAQEMKRAIRVKPLPTDGRSLPTQTQSDLESEIQPEVRLDTQLTSPDISPAAQFSLPTAEASSPSPVTNFAGLGDDNTKIPPDTAGAVGPNHLVVMLNSQVRIQNRTGTPLSTVSLASFWATTGASGPYQPQVVYDPFNDRWIAAAVSDRDSVNSSVLVGVSQTGNPTGGWNLYRYDTDATNTNSADYPMLGFNQSWVVVTVNRFSISTGNFVNSFIYTFKKADLYAGSGSPGTTIFTDIVNIGGPFPAVTLDNSITALYMARVWSTNVVDTEGASGSLRVATITGTVDAPSYNGFGPQVETPNPWAWSPPNTGSPNFDNFATQSGTSSKIQNGDSRLLNLVYRNGSLWAAHNAFLPASTPTRTAAQWWQISTTGILQQYGRVENTTGPIFYAYPSIAVNSQNDVMLGFSVFSSSQFASAGYTARAATDPAGAMRSPVTLKAGEASYFKVHGGNFNLWGDYSSTVVDPVNDLDFWTLQEYAASPQFAPPDYGRWGTWWGKINPPPLLGTTSWENRKASDNTLQGGATFTLGGATAPFACIGTATNPITVVDNGSNDTDPDVGQLQVNDVCGGAYTITETVVPTGWAMDTDTTRAITVSLADVNAVVGTQGIDNAGTTDESDFHNRVGSLSWENRKATDTTLQGGATFSVTPNPFTGSGSLVILDNDSNDAAVGAGQIQINNVLLAAYTITETIAPAGWALDSDVTRAQTVNVANLNAVVGTQGVDNAGTTDESDFHNRLGSLAWESRKVSDNTLQGGVTFDLSPNPLTGSGTLRILDNDGNDADLDAGQIQINNIFAAIYTITETIAPVGWAPDSDPTRAQTVDAANLNAVVGTQDIDNAGTTDESDFHSRIKRQNQLVSE